jgi:hypothetical protein
VDQHEQRVVALVGYFRRQGWKVMAAACHGYPEPGAVCRHELNVQGIDGRGAVFFGEVKTGKGDISSIHSRQQFHDFSSREVVETRVSCQPCLYMPKRALIELQMVLAQEGLDQHHHPDLSRSVSQPAASDKWPHWPGWKGEGDMTFEGAIIKEQGVTFAVITVRKAVLSVKSKADELLASAQRHIFPGVPVVLMAQDAHGTPTYYGRPDIVRFMASVPLAAVPWRKYTLPA